MDCERVEQRIPIKSATDRVLEVAFNGITSEVHTCTVISVLTQMHGFLKARFSDFLKFIASDDGIFR